LAAALVAPDSVVAAERNNEVGAEWRASLAKKPDLACELGRMLEMDQAVRRAFTQAGAPVDGPIARDMDRVDRDNMKRLKQIIRRYGWPDRSLVGQDGAQAAFLIAQHATFDVDFQKMALAALRASVERGQNDRQQLALLEDRVRMMTNEPQLYGTQLRIENGKLIPYTIADPEHVDARRAAMGLGPLKEYIAMVSKHNAPALAGAEPPAP
jgi:hypothetical protein